MAILQSIQIYPIKGLNAQPLTVAQLEPNKGIAGDRAYAIAVGNTEFDPEHPVHMGKLKFLMLMTSPKLAQLRLDMPPGSPVARIYKGQEQLLAADLSNEDGVQAFNACLETFMGDEGKKPFRLVTAPGHMFSDVREDCLSMLNLASVDALSKAMDLPLDPLRFRANLHVNGLDPWEERQWQPGHIIRINGCELEVMRPITRCAATSVDLATGQLDSDVPKSLSTLFGKNHMGLYVNVKTGGPIAVGNDVRHQGK